MTGYTNVPQSEQDGADSDDAVIGVSAMMTQETTTSDYSKDTTHQSMSTNTDLDSAVVSTSDTSTFVGLMNSGMTCYMNSLLQSLFMTPEFRNALFQWKFEGPPEEAETSIPYQLQRLFVQLCVTSHTAVNTLGLTTSFGWQATEVFQQQDIHELCRVMFDALEKKMGLNTTASPVPRRDSQGDYVVVDHVDNTQRHFINRLYQGQRSDRVRCCVCQSMSNKRATFLDIQVPLRPFGLDVSSYSSLDEAFRAMLKPERLDGSNQYYCSHCGKKQDAMLDCVYERMPYLLSLQLMRFTFDPRTGDRIKLNDRVSFPLEDWDISEFVVLPTDSPSHLEDHEASRTDCGAEGDHELFDDDEAVVCNLNEDGRVYCRPGLNGILSASNTTEPVEDEDVDLGTDSGANSGLDSPFGASSSLSPPHPMDGSASDSQHEVMDQEDGVPDQQPTLTVDQASQLRLSSFTRSMTDPLDTDDDDNDDGFGTGDTQSACSSLHDQNHDQQQFVDGPIHSTQPATLLGTATKTTGVVSGIMLDRTPTKTTMDEIQPATNVAHPASKPTSKLVYKLFSIVVHSGSISGGHYFAFIRSFADNQWYQFNDRHVTRANYADLLNTFGAKQPSYLSRASAYYLMYRRVDPLNNEHFLHEDEFPPHIAQMAKQIREQEAEEEAKRLRAMSLCKVNVSTRCPVTQEIISSSVDVYKDQTIEEATAIARAALLPTYGDVKNVNCRLVQYALYNDCFGQSVEYAMWRRSVGTQAENLPKLLGKEPVQRPMEGFSSSEVPTSQTLQSVCTEKPKAAPACGTASPLLVDEFINSYCTLWLEHRLNVPGALGSPVLDNKWRTYEPKGITFRISRVDISRNLVYPPERIWMPPNATLGELTVELWKLFTGQVVAEDNLPDEFKQLTVSTNWNKPLSGLALRQPNDHAVGMSLADVSTVLYSGTDSPDRLSSHLMDLFPAAVFDSSKRYNENHPSSVFIFVDLGPRADGLLGIGSSALDRFVSTHPNLWYCDTTSTNQTNNKSNGAQMEHICRTCQLRLLLDRFLFCVVVTVTLPTRNEVNTLNLQHELLQSTNRSIGCSHYAVHSTNTASSTIGRIVTIPTTPRFYGQDDMGVPTSLGTRTYSQSSAIRESVRRRSNSFSNLAHVNPDRDLMVPASFAPVKTQMTDSQNSSDEYFFVQSEVEHSNRAAEPVCRCPGCCTALERYAHRALNFESNAYEDTAFSDACVPSYRACIDKWVSMIDLCRLLGEYLNVNPKCIQVRRGPYSSFGSGILRPQEELTVSLTPCVDPLDMELAVHVLDLSGLLKVTTVISLSASSPLWPDPLKILCRLNWTVKQVLEVASTMLKLIYRLEIPHHRLCLRKCTLPECSPGPLLEPTSQLSSFRNPHQGVLLQLLEESMSPVSVPSSVSLSTVTNLASTSSRSGIFLFLRRWYPSTLTFSSSMFEVFIPPGSSRLKYWCATVEQICETHQIALDRFRFTACKFPGLLHCLAMEPEIASNSDKCQTWIALSSSDLDRLMPVNGQVVYFKDADEPCLKLTPEELQSYRVGPSWDSCSQDKPASMPALTYGPTLPPSYSDLTHTFGSNSVKRTYEQPLRIYTAEDHPPAPRATTKPT